MSCRGCDEKASRYGGSKINTGDVDNRMNTPNGSMAQPVDPMSAFISAKHFTYEELKERQDFSQKAAWQQSEHILGEMTDAMRPVHLEELVVTANSERLSIPGMSTDQAIVTIKDILDRPDFTFVSTLYPGLKEAVECRYKVIVENRLPIRKDG